MKVVGAFSTPTEAHLARAKLESAGITASIRDEFFVTFNWLASNAIGGVRLEVPDEDAQAASEILALPAQEVGVLQCPFCGSSDTHVRVLSVFGAVCMVLKLPIPMTRAVVDCQKCGKSFDAALNGKKG